MDRWQLFLEFLSFHRRFIIGCLLVAGLILFFTKILPVLPRFEGGNRPSTEPAKEERPGNSLDQKDTEQSGKPKSKQYYLESQDPEEIIEEAIRLRDSTPGLRSESARLVVADERFQLARRALGLAPNLQQRRTLASELTESTLILLQYRKKNDSQFDETEFLEIARKLRQDSDDEVRSFASVILTTSRYWNFRNQLSKESMNELNITILDNFEHLSQQPTYLRQFCIGLVLDEVLATPGLDLEAVIGELTKRMLEHESKEIRQIGEDFAMNYGFHRLFPNRLVDDLLSGTDEKTEARIKAYYDQLAKHPDASIPRHQIALDVIKAYLSLNQHVRAGQFLEQYENRILLHRQDKDSSERIREALEDLRKYYKEGEPR